MKKKLLSLILAVSMTALCGCAGGTSVQSGDKPEVGSDVPVDENAPVYGGNIVVGVQQDIDSLDPHKATAAGTKEILFNIFEGLVKPDEDGNLIGAVASGYTLSEDGYTYTFFLREGVKFHNGETVTAEDVKYSLERASGLLDGTPLISVLSIVTDVTVSDDGKEVTVTVSDPNPELIYNFTAAIIPAGSGEDSESEPIGTGPFKFVSYKPQESIVVEKNQDYWVEGVPYVDGATFKIIADPDTALLEMKGGNIDIYAYLTDSQATEISDYMNVEHAASNVVQALFLNNAVAPFDDVNVRRAVCYALGGDEVNEFVAGGNGTVVASAMLPALGDYYNDVTSIYGTSADPGKAKEVLAEAGYTDGISFRIDVPSNYEFHMQTAEVIAEQMKAAGIDATINPVEWNTWLSDIYTDRNYQATISGITSDLTPGYLMDRFESTSSKNFINYASGVFDAELAAKNARKTLEGRVAHYKKLQEIMADDAATAFIQIGPVTTAFSKNLHGYKFYPVYVQDLSTVYKS